MTHEEIIEKIRETLSEEFEVDIDLIQPDAPLMQTLELDSLDLVDMVVLIEKNFGFNVTGQDFVGIKTFQDFYNLVITRMAENKKRINKMWKGKTRGGVSGYLFFIYLIRYCGVKAAYGFLSLIVLYFIPFAPKATKSIWQYARRILKRNRIQSVGLLLNNYYRLGQILIDKVAIGNGMIDKYHFKFNHYQEFLNVLDGDQGVIMIGAHVGNWEIGTPFFNDYSKKMNVVMYDAEHQKIKEILKKNGQQQPYKIIPVNEDNLAHIFKITEALDHKEYVCFQGDRYLNADKLLTCKFMGHEAHFPIGPFLLASRMKVPVVFYFAMREAKQTYHFHFILAEQVSGSKEKRAEQLLLEQYVNALEKIIGQYPEQWFNYYSFWKPSE